ncbi:MAG TPA: radical SAM protein [Chloroflexota bacterium]|nr:radical SAM protein [Chloroflexota bacterium]
MSEWRLVYSDPQGNMREHPTLRPLGGTFGGTRLLGRLIPLPEGATLCMLPGCTALGADADGNTVSLRSGRDLAVGALLPTGVARLFLPAYAKEAGAAHLPLFGYTAVAARNGRLYAAAVPVDDAATWRPSDFNTRALRTHIATMRARHPENRLYRQLETCALAYGCYTAQNVFYRRWEGAIPVSPRCSARCIGCISEQDGPVPSPQVRLDFAPGAEEIADLAVRHFEGGGTMVSFGQGCEGDPLNRAPVLVEAVRLIRRQTDRGIININTNGWNYRGVEELCRTGLGRMRVSLFSAHPAGYDAYYRPRGYSIENVERSIAIARGYGLTVAINLLVFPGYIDCEGETEALIDLVRRTGANEIQLRTLNIDREMLAESVAPPLGQERGMATFIATLRREVPGLRLATHNDPHLHQPQPAAVGLP